MRKMRCSALSAPTEALDAPRWMEDYAKRKKASWRNDEQYLKRPRAEWGDLPVESIGRREVVTLLDTIARIAPVSANRTHTIISRLFSWAVESDLAPANPVAGLKKRAAETAKERTL